MIALAVLAWFCSEGAMAESEGKVLFKLQGTSTIKEIVDDEGRKESVSQHKKFTREFISCQDSFLSLIIEETIEERLIWGSDPGTLAEATVTAWHVNDDNTMDSLWTIEADAHTVDMDGSFILLTQECEGYCEPIFRYYDPCTGKKYLSSTVPLRYIYGEPGISRFVSYRSWMDIDVPERQAREHLYGVLQYSDEAQIRSEVAITCDSCDDDLVHGTRIFEVHYPEEIHDYYIRIAEDRNVTPDPDVLTATSIRIGFWGGHHVLVPIINDDLAIDRAIVSDGITLHRHNSQPYRPDIRHK